MHTNILWKSNQQCGALVQIMQASDIKKPTKHREFECIFGKHPISLLPFSPAAYNNSSIHFGSQLKL
jgi:hypothetical protein